MHPSHLEIKVTGKEKNSFWVRHGEDEMRKEKTGKKFI